MRSRRMKKWAFQVSTRSQLTVSCCCRCGILIGDEWEDDEGTMFDIFLLKKGNRRERQFVFVNTNTHTHTQALFLLCFRFSR